MQDMEILKVPKPENVCNSQEEEEKKLQWNSVRHESVVLKNKIE